MARERDARDRAEHDRDQGDADRHLEADGDRSAECRIVPRRRVPPGCRSGEGRRLLADDPRVERAEYRRDDRREEEHEHADRPDNERPIAPASPAMPEQERLHEGASANPRVARAKSATATPRTIRTSTAIAEPS